MHNLSEMITPALEQGFKFPFCSVPADYKNITGSRFCPLLLTAMESYTVRQSHVFSQMILNDDLKRDLALILRADWGQFCALSEIKHPVKNNTANLLSALLLSITLAAHITQRTKEPIIRDSIDFIIPEYQDMIYRLSNAMILSGFKPIDIINLLNGYAEIMPGRPLIACHRHPYDSVAVPLREITIHDRIAFIIMAASENLILDRIQACMQNAETESEKALFMEFSLIAQQHMIFLASFFPQVHPLETLYHCHLAEAFAYNSCAAQEDNKVIRQFYLAEKSHEMAHIKKLAQMIHLECGRQLAHPSFPSPLQLTPQKGYIRDMVKNLGVTLRRGKIIPVGSLKKGADFFRYQNKLCTACQAIPSHEIIMQVIREKGTDFRYEIAPHPVQLMQDRETDHTDIGR